ncbi:MAG: ZIP family metal transporter [Burkholderiales bacterium]
MTLVQILAATFAGGVLSVFAAAALSLTLLARWAPRLVSYAVGVLLGVAFLDLLPEAVDGLGARTALATCLGGLLGFFTLEKLSLWRHAHAEAEPGHAAHAHKPAGMMVVVGDAMHNSVDGVLIAAAFLVDAKLGWAVALGVIAHEIPHEIGAFMVLLDSGYSRRAALAYNALSGCAAIAGGVLGYVTLTPGDPMVARVLAISAASFIYISVADLIPGLHQHWKPRDAAVQGLLIAAGVAGAALLTVHS